MIICLRSLLTRLEERLSSLTALSFFEEDSSASIAEVSICEHITPIKLKITKETKISTSVNPGAWLNLDGDQLSNMLVRVLSNEHLNPRPRHPPYDQHHKSKDQKFALH